MILRRTMSEGWLSNSWLVADREGGHAVLVDSGGPYEPILAEIEALRLTLTHVLCTHHHFDHVAHNDVYGSRCGCAICGHARERELFGGLDIELGDGDELVSGGLHVHALHIPGHTTGQLAFVVDEERVFTGDTLFHGSVGGTRAPGHAGIDELKHSILDVLLKLPRAMPVHPGHTRETTIGREADENPFVRAWRGLDPLGSGRCTALGREATLLLRARDYDGGGKCWVRYDDGSEDVVGGSALHTIGP